MTERLMQYCWQHRLWLHRPDMVTASGEPVEVIDPGLPNTDSGPDFFNAKIKIGTHLWAGNVELHINASDWYRHKHNTDATYDTVILHVVLNNDGTHVFRSDGREIPQITIRVSDDFLHSYAQLVDSPFAALPCSGALKHIPGIHLTDWISALGFERLIEKSDRILECLHTHHGDWNEVIYITLARALGFGKNSSAFELLASATPLACLLKHRDSITATEAILLGQAGFLRGLDRHSDPYVRTLCREYTFMSGKFGLKPIGSGIWKTSGMRPHSFPHRRIATLAMYLHNGFRLGSALFDAEYADEIKTMLRIGLSPYWERHFTLGGPQSDTIQNVALSNTSLDLLVINMAAPVIYARGTQLSDTHMQQRAADILCSIKPEKNSKIQPFMEAGIDCRDAFSSQALLQLRKAYCDTRKCLYCRIGHRLLSVSSRR